MSDRTSSRVGDDGEFLTKKELSAVRTLERLAKRWPKTLWLFSASGSLCVMRAGPNGGAVETSSGGVDQEHCVTTIDIPNDGGDW